MDGIRTLDEVVEHCTQTKSMFGFDLEVLVPYLDFDTAKKALPNLTDDDRVKWPDPVPLTREHVLDSMRAYMAFGWDKVLGHRGLSAGRTVEKMSAWMWLLHDDEGCAYAEDDTHYPQYGAPILLWICQRYGFDVPNDDRIPRMAKGLPCRSYCGNGCGQ